MTRGNGSAIKTLQRPVSPSPGMNRLRPVSTCNNAPKAGRLCLAGLLGLWLAAAPAQQARLADTPLAGMTADQRERAVDLWRLCGRSGLLPALPPPDEPPPPGELNISADRIEAGESGTRLSGDISVIGARDRMRADRARLGPDRQRIELSGDVHYRSEAIEINADSLTRDTAGRTNRAGEASQLEFFIPLNHISGGARHMVRPDAETTRLYDMTYSTCDPGDREWHFQADEMELDHAAGFGTGRNMTLRLKDVPIFYFPYLTFPIDDRRRTGFLYPTVGDSSRHGAELELPWYWNIAPQADATITPHYMNRRGLKVDTEWRYLSDWSTNELHAEYLDDDRAGEERTLVGLKHSGRFATHWSTGINATEVSDPDYFEDFGADLSATSRVRLSRSASLTGSWDNWKLVNRLQTFQLLVDNVSPGSKPYRLLPEVELTGLYPDFALGLDFEMDTSYSRFDHDRRITGERFDIWPRLSRPFGSAGWFVTPAVGSRYTAYRLDEPVGTAPPTGRPLEPSRSTPVASLDSGLIFERAFGDEDGYLQTLEPRLFYLNVPFREQDDIPVFDTRRPDFSLFQLFEENRFVGADRMGDAKQLSAALTTRVLQRDVGEERLRLSLGRIRYYRDRRVTLHPGQAAETGKRSGLILEAQSTFADHWTASLTGERNPETGKADKGLFRLRYNRNNRYVFNLSYRYRRGELPGDADALRQTDLSFNLPVGARWSVSGRWNRDIERKRDLETFLGIGYESCCWAFRVMAREFLTGENNGVPAFDNAVYFELSFKGFTKAGSDIGQRLEHGIIGYQDPYE